MSAGQFFNAAYALAAREQGSLRAFEALLDEVEAKTPEGQERMRETWGTTPDAVASRHAAEGMFGPAG
jgi:hypothetical protein